MQGGGGGGGLTSGGDLGSGGNEVDLRVSNAPTESYMTPAHYSGYDEAEYQNLPQDHQHPHPYNLEGSPEFYSASGIPLEPKYQPPPFKSYPRGKLPFLIYNIYIYIYCPLRPCINQKIFLTLVHVRLVQKIHFSNYLSNKLSYCNCNYRRHSVPLAHGLKAMDWIGPRD